MFQGAIALSLDAKGRLAIPARHRDALVPDGAPLVITAHPHQCLLVYPRSTWEGIRQQVSALPGLDPVTASLKVKVTVAVSPAPSSVSDTVIEAGIGRRVSMA